MHRVRPGPPPRQPARRHPPLRTLPRRAERLPPGTCSGVLLVKGYATPEGAAAALRCAPDDARARLDELVAGGLAQVSAGSFRLTVTGASAAREEIAADGARWGVDRASAALDAFVALDARVKQTVTAWQMREVDGVSALNNHTDAAYDAGIIAQLDALHGEVDTWLAPLVSGFPRLAAYGERLGRAVAAARWRRRPLHRLPARRQLPRHLVRAARGAHPPRGTQPRRRGGCRARLSRPALSRVAGGVTPAQEAGASAERVSLS